MNTNQQSVVRIEDASIGSSRGSLLARVRRMLRRLSRDQRGASMLEYGVLCGCVAIAGITAVNNYGQEVVKKFGEFTTAMDGIGKKP